MRVTRTMKIDAPRQAVFKTAELLENILMHLPVKTVFGIQRVCRQFRDIVGTSTSIRQQLFLQPTGVERQTWAVRNNQSNLLPFFPYHPPAGAYFVQADDDAKAKTPRTVIPARLNPLLDLLLYQQDQQAAHRAWSSSVEHVYFTPIFTLHLSNKSASWRGMQLTDPPTTSANTSLVLGTGKSRSTRGTKSWDVEDRHSQGLTLGGVIDAGNESDNASDALVVINGHVEICHKATLDDMVEQVSEASRKPVKIQALASTIQLEGMVIPTEAEWEEMSTTGRTSQRGDDAKW